MTVYRKKSRKKKDAKTSEQHPVINRNGLLVFKQNAPMSDLPIVSISEGDEKYPDRLFFLSRGSRPRKLFTMGDISILKRKLVFVCGARNVSEYGEELARVCGMEFGSNDVPVASGWARGVDIAAHSGVLEAGGVTIAILPFGFSRFKWPGSLWEPFEDNRLVLMSELPPPCGFTKAAALRRNSMLVALSHAVIVIEPGETGGSWYSAQKASRYGRPLFYLEGNRPETIEQMKTLGGQRLDVKNGIPALSPVYDLID